VGPIRGASDYRNLPRKPSKTTKDFTRVHSDNENRAKRPKGSGSQFEEWGVEVKKCVAAKVKKPPIRKEKAQRGEKKKAIVSHQQWGRRIAVRQGDTKLVPRGIRDELGGCVCFFGFGTMVKLPVGERASTGHK